MESRTIVVCDDSKTVRKRFGHELTSRGFIILEATNGQEAIDLINKQNIDLLILDIEMPGKNGFETCKEIRELKNTEKAIVPIIFLTGLDSMDIREKGFQAGGTDFFFKEHQQADIFRVIDLIFNPERMFEGFTALVVEDNLMSRMVVDSILKEEGFKVIEAADGQQGLDLFISREDEIDIIIADYSMPVMDGYDMIKKIRAHSNNNLPIICLTAITDTENIIRFIEAKANDYITKPIVKELFKARVASHLKAHILDKIIDREGISTCQEFLRKKA